MPVVGLVVSSLLIAQRQSCWMLRNHTAAVVGSMLGQLVAHGGPVFPTSELEQVTALGVAGEQPSCFEVA